MAFQPSGTDIQQSKLAKKGGTVTTIPNFTPDQMNWLKQLLSGLQSQYKQGGFAKQANFDPIAKQAMTQFHTQTVPTLAERFTSLGGSDTRLGNPSFAGALGAAGAGLQEQLAALKAQYGLQVNAQNQQALQNLSSHALQPQFQTAYQPEAPSFWKSLTGQVVPGVISAAGTAAKAALVG
jgi:hypothetical protein